MTTDPSRPIYLSLGRAVAENDWIGRGSCTGQTSDYLEYVRGGDVLSFNDYVVNNGTPLEDIATGMDNLLAGPVVKSRSSPSSKRRIIAEAIGSSRIS